MSYPTAVAYYGLGLNRVTRLDEGWIESPDKSQGRMLHCFRMNTLFTPHAELQEVGYCEEQLPVVLPYEGSRRGLFRECCWSNPSGWIKKQKERCNSR